MEGTFALTQNMIDTLAAKALQAREKAYVPYSNFAVGAALLTKDGKIYLGCNIENASYTPSNCAERTAIFKAVSEGDRQFAAIAICGGPAGKAPEDYCPPCGVCRQVLSEFVEPDFPVMLVKSETEVQTFSFNEVLPFRFGNLDFLKEGK